jgi:hypothetical protein
VSALSMVEQQQQQQERALHEGDAALSGALGAIEREYGHGAVLRMGERDAQRRCEAISTGAVSLDLALGVGGMPRGRIVEVHGPESSGKTTLAYHVLARHRRQDRSALTPTVRTVSGRTASRPRRSSTSTRTSLANSKRTFTRSQVQACGSRARSSGSTAASPNQRRRSTGRSRQSPERTARRAGIPSGHRERSRW